jgi:hypothetical protein
VSFASQFQSSCQSAEASSNYENVDACTWVCADWSKLHSFILGDGAEDSTLYAIVGGMRVHPDQAIETHVVSVVRKIVDD